MFGVVPKKLWSNKYPADDNNLCTWALRCLLIEEAGKLVLIDTGMGNKQDDKFFGHYEPHGNSLVNSLKEHGFTPDDITDVVLTHLHFDHCGGAIVEDEDGMLVPQFKNAIYWSHNEHWQWATNPNDREKASFLKENILPIEESGQLQFIDTVDTEEAFFPGFGYFVANGHTESQIIPLFEYKGKNIAYMADLLPSTAHISLPWVMGYDVRPLVTLEEKKLFLEKAEEENYILFLEHDKYNECCTLQNTEKGVRVNETFALSDLG